MSKNEKEILRGILSDLKAGYSFGQDRTWNYYDNKPLPFPYFSHAMYITPYGNLGYNWFGSSAVKATLKDLEWLIKVIFKTTPSGFLREFIRNDQSKVQRRY